MNNSTYQKDLSMPVQFLKGVGQVRAEQLAKLGVQTVADLLVLLPKRYEDRRSFSKIRNLKSGAFATIRGEIVTGGWVKPRFGKGYYEAALGDGTGFVICRWFGASWLQDQLKMGDELIVFGKVSRSKGQFAFQHPDYETAGEGEEDNLHTGRIVPVYGLTENLAQKTMRRIQYNAVEAFAGMAKESFPDDLVRRLKLPSLPEALRVVHFPETLQQAERARYRLIFEEFLCIQLILVARKVNLEHTITGTAHSAKGKYVQRLLDALPFKLTNAQVRVLREIRADMARTCPMHRLLQGDVGSGKTLVAICAMLDAIECGYQAAVMAPTEILAEQHFKTIHRMLEPMEIRTDLLTGDVAAAQKRNTLSGIKSGRIQMVIGTHALIQDKVEFHQLGLVVIDEQHKFGVEQRGLLYEKGKRPDVLVMTATPIPRTLAMTVYGDLDTSILDELPAGRQQIVTRVIKEEKLPDAYDYIKKQVAKGRQAYLVYPLVSESDLLELKSAEEMYDQLSRSVFRDLRMGLLHGRLSSEEKAAVMNRFRLGEIDVLVATTVVEVGVDVPNANIMLVENAERFGLAQLHQLRGRIGRGAHKSYCILQGNPGSLDSWKRLNIMSKTSDGFVIAEEDLKIRGMGNLIGKEQSGFPLLKIGDPLGDGNILKDARKEAFRIVEEDRKLEHPKYALLKARAKALYREIGSFLQVG